MFSLIRKPVLSFLSERCRSLLANFNPQAYRANTLEVVFSEIYKKNKWGGVKGEFYSGPGSTDEKMVSPYIAMIYEKAFAEGFVGLTFVDLGCGDFRVSRRLLSLCSRYIG